MAIELFQAVQAGEITVENPKKMIILQGSAIEDSMLITQARTKIEPNFQLLPSIGQQIYLNSFNQKVSQMELSGIYVPQNECPQDGPEFLNLYTAENIVDSKEPFTINFSGITLVGYITSLTLTTTDNAGSSVEQFTLAFLGIHINSSKQSTDPKGNSNAAMIPGGSKSPSKVQNESNSSQGNRQRGNSATSMTTSALEGLRPIGGAPVNKTPAKSYGATTGTVGKSSVLGARDSYGS